MSPACYARWRCSRTMTGTGRCTERCHTASARARPRPNTCGGKGLFAYLEEHPDAAQRFDAGMASRHDESNVSLALGFDFSGVGTLVDVGGGNGSLLAPVLQAHPSVRGG